VCTARPELLERRAGWAGGKFIDLQAGAESGFDHADCFRNECVYVAHTGADRIDVFLNGYGVPQ
jgi:hypothetical protein